MPRPPLTADVAVVGAGPAGAAAAITLARFGRNVVLIDKARFPRDKCCGDGLTTAALRGLERLGLDPKAVASWQPVYEAVVVDAWRRSTVLQMPSNGQYAATARRVDLDAALVEVAVREGAELIDGNGVDDAKPIGTPAGPGVGLTLSDGQPVNAHYVIACDGMWSPTRKHVGSRSNGYLGDFQAGRQYFAGVGPKARQLWVWFEPGMLPGYAWSFPLPDGTANVGYGVVRRPGEPLGEYKGQRVDLMAVPHIAEVLGPDAHPASQWKAWPIPAAIRPEILSALDGRVLFAGDAARACDPMTGEGIAQALETAELASRAIVAAGPSNPKLAADRYNRQVRWGLSLDDKLARFLSLKALSHRRGTVAAVKIADTNDWTRRNFVRWMFEDYPRSVLATPHRWRRGMFTAPGAFVAK